MLDLQINSIFSFATSKKTDVVSLYVATKQKGSTVLGTGLFTHAAWFGGKKTYSDQRRPLQAMKKTKQKKKAPEDVAEWVIWYILGFITAIY